MSELCRFPGTDPVCVVLWGEGLPAEQLALHADTIPYELVCGVSQRVQVEYREGT